MTEITYVCPACGLRSKLKDSDPVPACCGEKMIPEELPVCRIPVSAESSRTGDEDGPCSDGTTPKKKA